MELYKRHGKLHVDHSPQVQHNDDALLAIGFARPADAPCMRQNRLTRHGSVAVSPANQADHCPTLFSKGRRRCLPPHRAYPPLYATKPGQDQQWHAQTRPGSQEPSELLSSWRKFRPELCPKPGLKRSTQPARRINENIEAWQAWQIDVFHLGRGVVPCRLRSTWKIEVTGKGAWRRLDFQGQLWDGYSVRMSR